MLKLIVLFPLLGFLINGLWYALVQSAPGRKKASAAVTGSIASLAIFGSFIVSVKLFFKLLSMGGEDRVIEQHLFDWFTVGTLSVPAALRLDSLSALFALVISGVGTLIHIYSIGYMSHDETPGKFFAYLNLFCFAMLVLVLGSSLPVLFLGWEGVGLCSYLLIGYWYTDIEKASAGKKAFVVNRVGDLGALLGMFTLFATFGTLEFEKLHSAVTQSGAAQSYTVTVACLLMFLGCCGKSAQIPLYIWLPDAMAGPTPVSALIHAATMVTSGIYLVSRLSFLYSLSPVALHVVAWIGALTALFAATIAIVQTDIKKVLAYSTVSQLGYMFLGCGVAAYGAGVFHVITHAFFKALLFLGAGSVIHGMREEQNILKMGGLKKYMPQTFGVFTVAWLAISGIPPFSGFFSKDEILWQAYSSPLGSPFLWAIGALTAVMTAFYMTRLYSLTFLGQPRFKEHGAPEHGHGGHDSHGVHESPQVMLIPLFVLAALSLTGGFMGVPHMSWLERWLEPLMGQEAAPVAAHSTEWVLMGISVAGALVGMIVAFRLFSDLKRADALKARWPGLHKLLFEKWYVDELYESLFIKPIYTLSQGLWKKVDIAVIDRVVLGFGRASEWTGQTLRVAQTGSLQVYAIMILIGLLVSVGYLIYGLA